MGSVVPFKRGLTLRAPAPDSGGANQPATPRIGIFGMVMIFTAVTVGMTGIAVLMGVNDWGEAVPLVLLISVVALVKIALANFVFFALIRADEQPDRRIPVGYTPPDPPAHRERPRVIPIRTVARGTRLDPRPEIAAVAKVAASAGNGRRAVMLPVIPAPRIPS